MRLFKAHSGPVHFCDFLADQKRIVSCSDDETVRVWDVTNEVELCCLKAGHNDYIRCGSVGNLSQDLFVSGSYDKTAVVWDLKSESKLASFDHGYPVEAVLLFPNDSLLLTAGGTVIKVWDLAGKNFTMICHNNYFNLSTVKKGCGKRKSCRELPLPRLSFIFEKIDVSKFFKNTFSWFPKLFGSNVSASQNDHFVAILHRKTSFNVFWFGSAHKNLRFG